MCVAAAIGGAAIGSIGGAVLQGNAAQSAAQTAANSQQQGINAQMQMFNTIQGEEAPGRNLGYGADSLLAQLYGIQNPNAPGATGALTGANASKAQWSNFENSPGYQFTLNQGQNAINRQAAASGGLYSTSTLGALNNYAQGQASTQYNNYVQQLLGLAGIGGQAVAGGVQNATTTGQGVANSFGNIGNANASGVLGSANAYSNLLGSSQLQNGLGQGGSYLNALMGGGIGSPGDNSTIVPYGG